MLAVEANNIWAKQAAALLDACPDMQPTHNSADEEDYSLLPQRNNVLNIVRCRLSCRLGINTESEEFWLYWSSQASLL